MPDTFIITVPSLVLVIPGIILAVVGLILGALRADVVCRMRPPAKTIEPKPMYDEVTELRERARQIFCEMEKRADRAQRTAQKESDERWHSIVGIREWCWNVRTMITFGLHIPGITRPPRVSRRRFDNEARAFSIVVRNFERYFGPY